MTQDEALDARRKEIFNEMKLMSNVHYPHFDFYTFRNTKSFAIADLKENKISFSSLSDFNDPVDSAYFQCADYYISTIEDPVMKMMDEVSVEAYNGLRCEDEAAIKDALDDKPDVKVYKIQISEQDIYSLEAVEIDRATWTPKGKDSVKPQCAVKRVFNCLKKSIKNECDGLK